MEQHRLPADTMAETPSVFMQLRLLASKVDRSVNEAKVALDPNSSEYHASATNAALGSNIYTIGSGMTLLRQKQEEVAVLRAAMTQFLANLRAANDSIEASLSVCEASLKDKTECMDRIEAHLKKYGYQPDDELSVPLPQQGVTGLPSSSAAEAKEKENGSCCDAAAAGAAEPSSACKTPSRAACRGPLITPGASTAKENVMRTPKLKDFASKETLSLIASVSKEESAAKRFVPRSLPFESMGKEELSSRSTDSSFVTRSANDGKPAPTIKHFAHGVLAAPNLVSWREAEEAASPDDLSSSVRTLLTPQRPTCVQQLFASTATTPAAALQPAGRAPAAAAPAAAGGGIQALPAQLPAADTASCCRSRMALMDDGEYNQLESYLRRNLSTQEINSAIHVLSQHFADPLADRSRDSAAAVLEDHLGRKSRSVIFLLIKTGRLQSKGAVVVPVDAASWSLATASSQ